MSHTTQSQARKWSYQLVPPTTFDLDAVHVPDYFALKLSWMRLLGGLLLIGFAPVIALCVVLVRLTSAGPGILRQTRVGKDGKLFKIYKIRTMYSDAEVQCGPVLCRPKDSRVTPVGKVLRFLHLDELPQLMNVVRGEMCLVGPRPERPEIIDRNNLDENVPGFTLRTLVLPGVTGLAQINLPADQTAACVVPKVKLDLHYISTANAALDLRILACTALRMLGVRHGHAVKLFRLARTVSREGVLPPTKNGQSSADSYVHPAQNPVKSPASSLVYATVNGHVNGAMNGSAMQEEYFREDSPEEPEGALSRSRVPQKPR